MAMVGLGISCSQREVSMRLRSAWAFSSSVWPPSSLPSAMRLDVAARAEAAPGAGEHHHADRRILGQPRQRLQQRVQHRAPTSR